MDSRGPPLAVGLAILCAGATAHADVLPLWSYDSYASGSSMVGVDGWVGGFSEDTWLGYDDRTGLTYVLSTTDNNATDYPGGYGEGGALDNWLVNEDVTVEDGELRVVAYTKDDDTLGIMFRFQDAQNFYALLLCGKEGTSTLDGLDGPYTALVSVVGGVATVLDASTTSYVAGHLMGLSLSDNDGLITAAVWQTLDSTWTDGDVVLTAADSALTGPGEVGLYAYDAGGTGSTETLTLFGEVDLLQEDDDGDGVPDDADNCEAVANADQSDGDRDGLGDLCDDSSPDTGTPDPGGSDTGTPETGDTGETADTADTADTGTTDSDTTGGTGHTGETAAPDTTDTVPDTGDSGAIHDSEATTDSADLSGPTSDLNDVSLKGTCAIAPRSSGAALALALALALARRRVRP